MKVTGFIASRLSSRSRMATISVAISVFVMVLAINISSGFSDAVRGGLSATSGDVAVLSPQMDVLSEKHNVRFVEDYRKAFLSEGSFDAAFPVVYRAGVVKTDEGISGVIFKGVDSLYDFSPFMHGKFSGSFPSFDGRAISSEAAISSEMADRLMLEVGDDFISYFIGEDVKARKFKVSAIYSSLISEKEGSPVFADIRNMRRLNGWAEDRASSVELTVSDGVDLYSAVDNAYAVMSGCVREDDPSYVISSAESRFPALFDWLKLLDFNLYAILILMFVVSGFNMISGLLIILFENISVIGLLKALGMRDKAIAGVFLSKSTKIVLAGMLFGNAAAMALSLLQKYTGLVTLNPENYIISVLPVSFDWTFLVCMNVVAYFAIMLLLLIPCVFISGVDPARTVRMN